MLFDILFGLLLFLSVGTSYALRGVTTIFFYVIAVAILLHWWLKYKAADDTYGLEVSNSALDLLFGLVEILFLEAAMIAAARSSFTLAAFYFCMPLVTEALWGLLWRSFGKWRRVSRKRAAYMEQSLDHTISLNLAFAAAIGLLIFLAPNLSVAIFIAAFTATYACYVALTHRYELIDVRWM